MRQRVVQHLHIYFLRLSKKAWYRAVNFRDHKLDFGSRKSQDLVMTDGAKEDEAGPIKAFYSEMQLDFSWFEVSSITNWHPVHVDSIKTAFVNENHSQTLD